MRWEKIDIPFPEGDFVDQVQVGGKKICLVREKGKFYAFQNTCPHAGGILAGGWCEHGNLICPIHRYTYSLETGMGAPGQGDYIRSYPLLMQSDGLYIGFKDGLWKRFFRK